MLPIAYRASFFSGAGNSDHVPLSSFPNFAGLGAGLYARGQELGDVYSAENSGSCLAPTKVWNTDRHTHAHKHTHTNTHTQSHTHTHTHTHKSGRWLRGPARSFLGKTKKKQNTHIDFCISQL